MTDLILHRIQLKARALPGNPTYWTTQFGFLNIWMYHSGSSEESIEETPIEEVALSIAAIARYEVVGEQISVTPASSANSGTTYSLKGDSALSSELALREQLAKESGLSLMFIAAATGVDEGDFEACKL